jgi:hypothetical protein
MKRISRSRRDMMVEAEVRKVTWLFLDHSRKADDWQRGVDALDAHWREIRHSPISKWVRFYVVTSKEDLLIRMGRLEEALIESNRSLWLPASSYARINEARSRTVILRGLGRPEEAFQSAMTGLRRCARTRDVHSSQGLILEILRLRSTGYLEELAAKYGELVLAAVRLPNQVQLIGPATGETPIQALKALREGMRKRMKSAPRRPRKRAL